MGSILLLGQEVARDPTVQEGFPSVDGGPEGGAEAVELLGEERGEGGEVGGHMDSAYTVLLTACLYFSS